MRNLAALPFDKYIAAMRRIGGDEALDLEQANPPRCDSSKAYREGAPLTEALEIARNKYAAKTGQPLMDLTDDGVFCNAKTGNKRAIELIASRVRSRVLIAVQGKPLFFALDDAEDLAQEATLRVVQNIHKIPESRSLIPYALRTAGRLAIDLKRKEARRGAVIVFDSELVDSVLSGGPDHE